MFGACVNPHVAIGPGQDDFSVKLAGDYSLDRTSAHEITIAPEVWNDSIPTIPSKVIECATDGRFIIAKRQGLKRRNLNPKDTYKEPDPGVFDYWILDTNDPASALGPLSKADFDAKRKGLKIADTLTMKDIYSFRR